MMRFAKCAAAVPHLQPLRRVIATLEEWLHTCDALIGSTDGGKPLGEDIPIEFAKDAWPPK